ncbi:MAG: LexA family protein, partial [Clostridiales bacterium]
GLLRKNPDCFALKVKGDSMINAGIFEGDLVIVVPQKNARNGEIIVALIGDDATVKRFFRNGEDILLIAENNNYQPIVVKNREDFSIIGKVIGIQRWYY